jgi:hypothetical protein
MNRTITTSISRLITITTTITTATTAALEAPKACRLGYMGHLIRICSYLQVAYTEPTLLALGTAFLC